MEPKEEKKSLNEEKNIFHNDTNLDKNKSKNDKLKLLFYGSKVFKGII